MRLLFIVCVCLVGNIAAAQSQAHVDIIGKWSVEPATEIEYFADYQSTPYMPLPSGAYWTAVGGSITEQDMNHCKVIWNNSNTPATISLNTDDNLYYQNVSALVYVGYPYLWKQFPQVDYGNTVNISVKGLAETKTINQIYWEVSIGQVVWTPAGSGDTYSAVVTAPFYVRAHVFYLGNTDYYTPVGYVTLKPLQPGQISDALLPAPGVSFNVAPTITTTPALGGKTRPIIYSWEVSYHDDPYFVFGAGEVFPGGIVINDRLSIRRKASCGNETVYSNVLSYTPVYATADFENLNYVRENDIVIPGISSWYVADQLPTGQKFETTNYLDGLGRTIQTVAKQASKSTTSTTFSDMVSVHDFDAYGREDKNYLPFTSSNAIGKFKPIATVFNEQINYIHTKYSDQGNTYSQAIFEISSLGRITKSMLPGTAFGNSNIGTSYGYAFNNSEIIKIWEIGYAETDLPYTTGSYAPGKLYKTTTTDEKNKQVIEFKDLSGNLILTQVQDDNGWLSTYYVYDDMGRLRFTITPKAVNELLSLYGITNNWNVSQILADELCFSNYYDEYGNVVVKHSAGAGNQEMVYDQRNRPLFSSDESDKEKHRWLINIPDGFDRLQVKGFIYNTANPSVGFTRQELKAYARGVNIAPVTINVTSGQNNIRPQNLEVNTRNPWVNVYIASEEIVFNPGFETEQNAGFEALIDNTPLSPKNETIVTSGRFFPPTATLVTLAVNYYDTYSYADVKSFSGNYTFPSSSEPNIITIAKANRTFGLVTGQRLRVINDDDYSNDAFLLTSSYYDERGNPIQQVSDNYLQGVDVFTNQYDYKGRLLHSCMRETMTATAIQNFPVITKYSYDDMNRLYLLSKSYNGSAYKKLVEYAYDDMGQLESKKLSPDYGIDGLETLNYTYNLQGMLTGINKDYVNDNQWQHYFGMELGYESSGTSFTASQFVQQYNGSIAGAIWKSRGDNKPRQYNYRYDSKGYLTNAFFTQKESPASSAVWNKDKYDFSVPLLDYDANGNLLQMQQKGVIPGQTSPVLIDDLHYTYAGNNQLSNRLGSITDAASTGTANGILGDFSSNLSGQQYTYNAAGNLVKDLNKHIQTGNSNGIAYNILNKPLTVVLQGKYNIEYVYDASGAKLARKVTNTSVSPNTVKWEYYVNDIVFDDHTPLYFVNETGRLRVSKEADFAFSPAPSLSLSGNSGLMIDGKKAFYDFYLTDHLDNTRMVLTEEEHNEYHKATMEVTDARQQGYEERMFGNVDVNGNPASNNEVIATRNDMPIIWTSHYSNSNKKASKLDPTHPVGPNVFLKVMAGDNLDLSTDYFYNQSASGNSNIANTIISSLVNALVGNGAATAANKNLSSQINSQLNGMPDYTNILNNPTGTGIPPNAHINWLFFDENFNPVSQGALRVTSNNDYHLTETDIQVPANGYVYIYLSNSSNNAVYFDEFWVRHKRGRILQEHHYYPYGLQIASISSKAAGEIDNMYRYQGAYSDWEEETGLSDFELRSYDAQVGRWTGVDPYDEFASGYVGMGNDPVSGVDPNGGNIFSGNGLSLLNHLEIGIGAGIIGAFIGGKENAVQGFAWGFGAGVTGSYLDYGSIGNGFANAGKWVGNKFGGFSGTGEWNWLTKEALYQLTIKYSNRKSTSNGDLENNIGNNFEDNWNRYASQTTSLGLADYRGNTELSDQFDGGNDGNPQNIRNVIIDAKANVEHTQIDGAGVKTKTFYRAAWFEIKATKRKIVLSTSGNQIKSELYHLAQSEPEAVNLKIAQYNVVSTFGGENKIGKGVYDLGNRLGIQVFSIQPKYRIRNGSVEVQFLHETKFGNLPLFPIEYNHIMRYRF